MAAVGTLKKSNQSETWRGTRRVLQRGTWRGVHRLLQRGTWRGGDAQRDVRTVAQRDVEKESM